ncbi:hypothetical protein [Archaeoglobus veneficus]|uniref:Uncharacterized protein n=2 Tax=root TaxID=1 RepID=F2KMG5_ARCVS|nr:hypothetical protein [Archaeoglobus veneficus]AEA46064.1 hypothetical protein Arcve_0020 [Archaeoglobus veneficus SNP6]
MIGKNRNSIFDRIEEAIESDGFLLLGVTGDKGRGKSVLALNIAYEVLQEWNSVLRHTIFTIEDFYNLEYRKDVERAADGRVKIAVWDDFALHTSSYGFLKGDGERIANFIEEFEVVRENVAVLVITAATWDMVPPKLRNAPHVLINMYARGKGLIFERDESSPFAFLRKIFRVGGKIKSEPIPDEIYRKYRMLKRNAILVKRRQAELRLEKYAAFLADKMLDGDWKDEITLKARGLLDLHGNLTKFGEMVLLMWINAHGRAPKYLPNTINNIPGAAIVQNDTEASILKKTIEKRLTTRALATILRNHGVRINQGQVCTVRRALLDLLLNSGNGNGNGKHPVTATPPAPVDEVVESSMEEVVGESGV